MKCNPLEKISSVSKKARNVPRHHDSKNGKDEKVRFLETNIVRKLEKSVKKSDKHFSWTKKILPCFRLANYFEFKKTNFFLHIFHTCSKSGKFYNMCDKSLVFLNLDLSFEMGVTCIRLFDICCVVCSVVSCPGPLLYTPLLILLPRPLHKK